MRENQYKIIIYILLVVIIAIPAYFKVAYKPKNSLELYQAIRFAEDYSEVQKLSLKGYEGNFSEAIFEEIVSDGTGPSSINQFTVFQYEGESYMIETTPGTLKLEILRVVKLPKELKDNLHELTK